MARLISSLLGGSFTAWRPRLGFAFGEVRPGTAYVRRKTWGVIETARVSQVIEDAAGVRHIRFELTSRHRDRSFADGPRTMGLQCFMRLYRLQV